MSKHLYLSQPEGCIRDIGASTQWQIQELSDWQAPSLWDNKELGIVAFNDLQQILVANHVEVHKATQFALWQNGSFKAIDSEVLAIPYAMNNQGVILGRKWMVEKG